MTPIEKLKQLEQAVRVAREALEFYAEPVGYARSIVLISGQVRDGMSPVDADAGHEARTALAALNAAAEKELNP